MGSERGALKRTRASRPFGEKGREKRGTVIAAAALDLKNGNDGHGADRSGKEECTGRTRSGGGDEVSLTDDSRVEGRWTVLAGDCSAAAKRSGLSQISRLAQRPSFPGRQLKQVEFAFVQAQPLQEPVLLHLQHCFELRAIIASITNHRISRRSTVNCRSVEKCVLRTEVFYHYFSMQPRNMQCTQFFNGPAIDCKLIFGRVVRSLVPRPHPFLKGNRAW